MTRAMSRTRRAIAGLYSAAWVALGVFVVASSVAIDFLVVNLVMGAIFAAIGTLPLVIGRSAKWWHSRVVIFVELMGIVVAVGLLYAACFRVFSESMTVFG